MEQQPSIIVYEVPEIKISLEKEKIARGYDLINSRISSHQGMEVESNLMAEMTNMLTF